MKRVMSFAYNKANTTALAYDVKIWLENLGKPDLYLAVHLVGKRKPLIFDLVWPGSGVVLRLSFWAAGLNCTFGRVSKNDLLQYKDGQGRNLFGFAKGFACAAQARIVDHVAFVEVLAPSIARGGWKRLGALGVVRADALVCSVPFFTIDSEVFPLLHADL